MMHYLLLLLDVKLPSGVFREKTTEIIREAAADAPQILGIGVSTLLAVLGGGSGVGLAFGAYKLAKVLFTKNRKESPTATDCVAPFPRKLDEARQHRDLARYVESRIPEYDTAVGRIFDDELQVALRFGTLEENKILREFAGNLKDRANKLLPPSTKEYINNGS